MSRCVHYIASDYLLLCYEIQGSHIEMRGIFTCKLLFRLLLLLLLSLSLLRLIVTP